MTLVAGVDCSTQATKVLICDAATGGVVREGRADHPDATEVDPAVWWDAFEHASDGLLDDVEAIAVGGQQHGMVLIDDTGKPVRDALLWNDNRSARAAAALIDELGGSGVWAESVGVVPVASITVTKLRWVAEHEEDKAERAAAVALPHDWLTWRLAETADVSTLSTDRGDASGTGYWCARDGDYRLDLLSRGFGRELVVPRVAEPAEVVGHTSWGAAIAPGSGDNMAAALGLGLEPGDVVVSLGTSGAVFAMADRMAEDPAGLVAGFADATGAFLPLACTLNAARVISAAATMAGARLDDVDGLVADTAGSDGLTLLPFLDGERTPALPDAAGLLYGLTRKNATPGHLVRASVEGMLCGLADAVDALRGQGAECRRVILIGGASRSRAVQSVAAGLFDVPVVIAEPAEYVALGAARQAAWALSGDKQPPDWAQQSAAVESVHESGSLANVRDRYRAVLDGARPLLT